MLVDCLTSQQHASVSPGRICTDNFTCCHTEVEVTDPTFHLTQSQYTDTGPTSPSTDPITPGAWLGSHWSANFEVTGMTLPRKNPGASGNRIPVQAGIKSRRKRESNPGSSALDADALTTRQTRRVNPAVHTRQPEVQCNGESHFSCLYRQSGDHKPLLQQCIDYNPVYAPSSDYNPLLHR